jgi:hypothetical protein
MTNSAIRTFAASYATAPTVLTDKDQVGEILPIRPFRIFNLLLHLPQRQVAV